MEIKQKPLEVKLSRRGKLIRLDTPFASIEAPEYKFAFLTQGLAYSKIPIKLKGPRDLQQKFTQMLDAQFTISHLSSLISPFLHNYLVNKCTPMANRVQFDHLADQLAPEERILFCGAGPSLYESWGFVEWCLETGYATVIAGGSAIRAFSNRGLVPDLCLVCDPKPGVASRADLPSEFQKSTVLLADSGVHPQLLANWEGPVVLTHGMSATAIGTFLEPGKVNVSTGSIGVSTFAMNVARSLPNVKELLLLGVDLGAKDGKIYPDHLGFDNAIDAPREHIWKCEAQALGSEAARSSYRTLNLATNGRDLPNTTKVCPTSLVVDRFASRKQLETKPHDFTDFRERLADFYRELQALNLDDISQSPTFKPFLELYHNIYTSRVIYTGEYAKDSFLIRIEYLKTLIEDLLLGEEHS